MTKDKLRRLSELEGVSLGIVYKQQACTAYQVRRELKKAPSSHWRASAGSVYPLLARLEAEGLLRSTSDENDGRGRKLIKVTASGRRALREWVVAGVDMDLISSVTDPVRSRTFFLDVLGSSKQLELVDKLIVQMEIYLAETKSHQETETPAGNLYDYLGGLGAVKITTARLDWLLEVRKQLRKKHKR
jgi:DNA-binding PadR family transcriptional regulator